MAQRMRIAVVLGTEDRDDMARFAAALGTRDDIAVTTIELPAMISDQADFIVVNLGMRPEAELRARPSALWSRLVLIGVDRARVVATGSQFMPAAMVEYAAWRAWVRQPTSIAVLAVARDLAAGYRQFADLGDNAYALIERPSFNLPMLLADCLTRLHPV